MASKIGNRVKETSDTTGTGTLDLAGAPTGFRAFGDEFTSGDTVYYLIVDDPDNPTAYELGVGTFTAGTPDTLSRDTVEDSSNSGSKVSFVSGTKTVISTPTAAMLGGKGPLSTWALKNAAVLAKTANYTVLAADDGKLIDADGSGNSPAGLTLTLPAAASNANMVLGVINTGASGTVTIDGNASETIDGATTLDLAAQYDGALLWCDGTGWHALVKPLTASSDTAVVGDARGAVAKYATASTVDFDADAVVLKNADGTPYLAESVNLTADLTAAGANGLDNGSEATSTWYYLWVIYNGTTVAALISTSATSPTLPSGYTYKALVGAFYNESSGDIRRFFQADRRNMQAAAVVFNSIADSATFTSASISLGVPPIAKTAGGVLGRNTAGGDAAFAVAGDANGVGLKLFDANPVSGAIESFNRGAFGFSNVPMITAQTIYWRVGATSTSNMRMVITEFTF